MAKKRKAIKVRRLEVTLTTYDDGNDVREVVIEEFGHYELIGIIEALRAELRLRHFEEMRAARLEEMRAAHSEEV